MAQPDPDSRYRALLRARCETVRDDREYWRSVESLRDRLGADFTHGVCPACQRELYPDTADA